jgi:hypothetical protein
VYTVYRTLFKQKKEASKSYQRRIYTKLSKRTRMRVILTAYNRNQLRSESDQLDDSVENQPSPSHTTSENCVVEGDEEILPESETFEDKSLPESLVSAVTAHLKPAATVEATPRLKICDEAKVTLSTSEEPEQKLPATKSDIGTRKRKLSQGAPVDSLQANQKKPAAIDPVDSKKPAAKMTAGRYPDEEREPPPPADENTISVVEKNDANVFADRALPSRDDFTKILKQRGLEIRQQEGDGNCLFRAVSFQVYGDANMHMDVRQQCLDHMAKDEAHFAHFVEDEDFSAYIKRKRQEGVHGNNPEIQAISELFNRPVEVFTPDNGASPLNIFQADYKTSELPIRLSYAESHYNAVVDPLLPTAGLGLGLPGLQPGLADKMQMDKAVRESDQLADNAELKKAMEDSHNDQLQRAIKESSLSNDQMYSNKAMALSDLEATSLDIEQAVSMIPGRFRFTTTTTTTKSNTFSFRFWKVLWTPFDNRRAGENREQQIHGLAGNQQLRCHQMLPRSLRQQRLLPLPQQFLELLLSPRQLVSP